MNATLLCCVPPDLPFLTLTLQGAAGGALIASAVLCVARKRGLHVEAWAVTAAWSVLGATVASIAGLVVLLA